MKKTKILTNYYYKPTAGFKEFVENNKDWVLPFNGGNTFPDEFENTVKDQRADENWMLNECTAILTLCPENYRLVPGDTQAIGLQNYRRVFRKEDLELLWNCDALFANPIPLGYYGRPVQLMEQYARMHVYDDFCKFSQYVQSCSWYNEKAWLEWTHLYVIPAPCNTFAMNREVYTIYCREYIKFYVAMKNMLDIEQIKQRDDYQRRAIAFLSERFLSFWAYSLHNYGDMNFKSVPLEEHLDWKPDLNADLRGSFTHGQNGGAK